MKARIVLPPSDHSGLLRKVFLAGSIEMGNAEDWQTRVIQGMSDLDITILNPRREAWDASWEQSIDNPQFKEQVDWELNGLESAELILLYLVPGTKSPISLLEFGIYARSGKMLVCCPEGFWRKGNVDIVCHREGIPQFGSVDELVAGARAFLAG